jgi:hypothetical protein
MMGSASLALSPKLQRRVMAEEYRTPRLQRFSSERTQSVLQT